MQKIDAPKIVVEIIEYSLAVVLMTLSILTDTIVSVVLSDIRCNPSVANISMLISATLSCLVAMVCAKVFEMRYRWTLLGLLGKSLIVFAHVSLTFK